MSVYSLQENREGQSRPAFCCQLSAVNCKLWVRSSWFLLSTVNRQLFYGGLQMERIVIDKDIRHGKPVIRGTRVPVDIILGSLAGGMSYKEVCEDYAITEDDIKAAMEYATKLVANEEIHILEAI